MAVTQQQARVYMSSRESGDKQVTASARAGVSVRTGRRLEKQGEYRRAERHWRTHQDVFEEVWIDDVVPLLTGDDDIPATLLLEYLQRQHPEKFRDTHLRTLQRRLKHWRATQGPDREVMFLQKHEPGRLGLSDFTELKRVKVTIRGEELRHRLYHFRLAYSGYCSLKVVLGGESYAALAEGLTQALSRLGGTPQEHRTDSVSAAYRNLSQAEADDITERYKSLCKHYGMKPTRNNRGCGHENGSIESSHGHMKRRVRTALKLRGSTDFDSVDDYRIFIDGVARAINKARRDKILEEKRVLRCLPANAGVDYTQVFARVTTSATITVRLVIYSVPSRLIGQRLVVHLYDDKLKCYCGSTLTVTRRRVYPAAGKRRARCIDYRHIIESLVRKPMAFYRSALRDDILPNEQWRELWAKLDAHLDPRSASKLMVTALHLASLQGDTHSVFSDLHHRVAMRQFPTPRDLRRRFDMPTADTPQIETKQHSLGSYDSLIAKPLPLPRVENAIAELEAHHG